MGVQKSNSQLNTFAHVRFGHGFITLAIQVVDSNTTCGVAFSSSKDQFNRKLGREIATARLKADNDDSKVYRFNFILNKTMRFGENVRRELWRWLVERRHKYNYTAVNGIIRCENEIRNVTLPRWCVAELEKMAWGTQAAEDQFVAVTVK
jgi:hypothetical protein